jgi:NADH-ubiquinone oxidoreductase chain 2
MYGKFGFFDSTISHIGFILLALSISTQQSIESFIFYIIQYSITNLNTFLILIALSFLTYNSSIQNLFINLIKSNYYFSIIFISLQKMKSNKIFLNIFTIENLFKFLTGFILRSKNSVFFKLSKEIKKELIETDIKYIYDLKGQFFSNPILSLSLSICLFSMAGI